MKNIHQRWWADDKEENKKMPKNVGVTSIAVGRVLALHSVNLCLILLSQIIPKPSKNDF